jgi:hypothetical protein
MSVDFDGSAGRLDYGDLRSAAGSLGNSYGDEYTVANVKGDGSSATSRIWWNVTSAQGSNLARISSNAFRFSINDTPQNNRHDTDTTYSTGTWYKLYGQATVSGADDIDIYRDGTLGTGSRVTASSPGNIDVGATGMYIGARDTGTPDHFWDGEISQVAIWQQGPTEYFDNAAFREAVSDHNFSPFFFRYELRFYAPLMDVDHDADLISGTDPTQTATVATGTGDPYYKIENYLANGGMMFTSAGGGGGGGSGIKWNGTDIDFNGLTNDKWNGYA